ncbi:rod shape-determining protein [Micromonospora sp. NPDC003197]
MLGPGVYARPGVPHPLAIDLGTANVRIWTPAAGSVIDEPTVVAYDSAGVARAVGQAALTLARSGGVRLVRPIQDGVIDDFRACVHLLQALITASARPAGDVSPVLVGVPATATLWQQDLLTAAVGRVTGGRVVAVEEPLAAALSCRSSLDTSNDVVAVDLGQGRTEVVRITGGTVTAAERVGPGNLLDQVPAIAATVRQLTCESARLGHRRLLLLTGGGAAGPNVASRLAALTGRIVTMPVDSRLATIRGLRLLMTA